MGLGGVAIVILPSIMCLKLTFSDGLGGTNIAAAKQRLKIQKVQRPPERWTYSIRVRGPHFASKVSYNAGAATDDYAGQRKSPLRGRCRQT